MDLIKELKKDLEQGFSKRDLERLIGLPENCLSNVLSGKKKLSRKSEIKIEKWASSKKPDPFSILPIKKDNRGNRFENTNKEEIKIQEATQPTTVIKPTEQPKTNFTINTTEEVMPEGLNWKEEIQWYRNHKK